MLSRLSQTELGLPQDRSNVTASGRMRAARGPNIVGMWRMQSRPAALREVPQSVVSGCAYAAEGVPW